MCHHAEFKIPESNAQAQTHSNTSCIPRMLEGMNEQTAHMCRQHKIGINVDAANNLEADVGAERRCVTDE